MRAFRSQGVLREVAAEFAVWWPEGEFTGRAKPVALRRSLKDMAG